MVFTERSIIFLGYEFIAIDVCVYFLFIVALVVAFISIFAAVMVTMISVGISRPDPTVYATRTVSFVSAFGSVMNIIFAFGGHVAFFSFISELKDPRDFPKALYTLQIVNTSLYVIAAALLTVLALVCAKETRHRDLADVGPGSGSGTVEEAPRDAAHSV